MSVASRSRSGRYVSPRAAQAARATTEPGRPARRRDASTRQPGDERLTLPAQLVDVEHAAPVLDRPIHRVERVPGGVTATLRAPLPRATRPAARRQRTPQPGHVDAGIAEAYASGFTNPELVSSPGTSRISPPACWPSPRLESSPGGAPVLTGRSRTGNRALEVGPAALGTYRCRPRARSRLRGVVRSGELCGSVRSGRAGSAIL